MRLIDTVTATEILDSRSRPTLAVTVSLADGTTARAGVPSGASTGTREAVELRDGDPNRYAGAGVSKAVGHVNGEIADALRGKPFADLGAIDTALIELDGTPTKSRLGANAIVGVSMASARAIALSDGDPLWRSLMPKGAIPRFPGACCFNVLNGGVHAANRLDFQEFMITPLGAPSVAEAVRAASEVYTTLRHRLAARGLATGLGDEGGFAPEIDRPEDVLTELVAAIIDAGYVLGRDGVAIALDPASSEFYREGAYHVAGERLSTDDMITRYGEMVARFPVWSLEDGSLKATGTGGRGSPRLSGSAFRSSAMTSW